MPMTLILDTEGTMPLYQQLKYQLIYLISSRQLPEGEQLPTIRELADSLQINIGTVAQAYRELQADGLIESIKGRGTFVKPLRPHQFSDESVERQIRLTNTLTDALTRAYSLGFSAVEIQQRVASLLSQGAWRCHLAFVGPTPQIARKHSAFLQEQLGANNVVVHSLDVAALESGKLPDGFDSVFYVTTFLSLVHTVEHGLARFPEPRRVLPLPTRVSEYTLGSLAILPATTKACLIAEERNTHSALNLITTHSRIPRTLPRADPADKERVLKLCDEADVVIHTFLAGEHLDALEVPDAKRLEMHFEIDPDAVADIKQLLRAPSKMPVVAKP